MKRRLFLLLAPLPLLFGGCLSVRTEPIEVKPIHVTVDVNVKVDREVSNLLGDIYGDSKTINVPNSPAK
jgi:hypothetical protein